MRREVCKGRDLAEAARALRLQGSFMRAYSYAVAKSMYALRQLPPPSRQPTVAYFLTYSILENRCADEWLVVLFG